MKLGAENMAKTAIALLLFVVALFLVTRMLYGTFASSSSSAAPAAPAAKATAASAPRRAAGRILRTRQVQRQTVKEGPVTPSLDPRLHLDTLKETESLEYTGKGRNIFLAQMEDVVDIPEPKSPGLVGKGQEQPPPPPPQPQYVPPPINLKFFGFASQQGEKRALISSGDDVFVAAEGQIVNRRYKILRITPTSIDVQDVLSNNRQTIPLSAASS